MKSISIDLETFSEIDIGKAGVYRYSEDPSFEILLFGYSVDQGPVTVIDLTKGEKIPEEIIAALDNPKIEKWAYNCSFERICLSRFVGHMFHPEGWYCTMIWAATLGLPLSLASVGQVLGLEKQKLQEGKNLIRYFCVPCKPTKANGMRTRNLPEHAPDKWKTFVDYNQRDVEAEVGIQIRLRKFPVSDYIWQQYHLDQLINDGGIQLDMVLVEEAIQCDEQFRQKHMQEAQVITGLDNPNSTQQLKGWLEDQGMEVESLSKAAVKDMLSEADGEVEQALQLRQLLAKSSVKKYVAMENAVCSDGRARGLIQFFGAHTGRYCGRLIQVQNLPQNKLPDLDTARSLVRSGNFELVELLYDSVPDVLSQLIRTSFVPRDGYKFLVADFSAIEARCIAWLANESWRLQVFADNKDIYCASASQMFKVPVEKHGVNGHLRQKGKIAELALGYGGSTGALVAMGAIDMGLQEEELKPLVDSWRASNPSIVNLWWDVDKAVMKAVREHTTVNYKCLVFEYASGMLFIKLPSGRRMAYVKPRITENSYGRDSVSYEGVGATKQFTRIQSYGPRYVENIIQGIARDILAEAMDRLWAAGYRIRMHVHDEVVIEAPMDAKLEDACRIMSETPDWAQGLLLRADGYECSYYQKD